MCRRAGGSSPHNALPDSPRPSRILYHSTFPFYGWPLIAARSLSYQRAGSKLYVIAFSLWPQSRIRLSTVRCWALFSIPNAEQPPPRTFPAPARLSFEIKLHGVVRGCDHFVPVLASVHLGAAVVALPCSAQDRNTARTVTVRPRQTNSRGRPGSPTAMREVSAVSVMGLMASLMNRSSMAGILQGQSNIGKGLCKLIHGILESFVRDKPGGVVGADLNFCAGLWIAGCTSFALDHLETSESHQATASPFFSILTIDSKTSTAACASILVLRTFATSLTRSALFMIAPLLSP